FALLGATIATVVGGAVGSLAGTLEIPGRWWLLSLSVVLLAAPPAFWWIGFTRAPLGMPGVSGLIAGSTLSGMMLAPIPLLLVLAATREIPSNTSPRRASPSNRRNVAGTCSCPCCARHLSAGF